MSISLVQFKNKNNCEELTEKIQIEQSIDTENITAILNAIRTKQSTYTFYIGDKRLVGNLQDTMKLFAFNSEDTISIEYIDETESKADEQKETVDTVINLAEKDGEIIYLTYNGDVFKYKDNTLLNKNIKGIFGCYSYNDFNIYNNNMPELAIVTTEEKIVDCCCNNGFISIATEMRVYLFDIENSILETIREHCVFIRSIQMNENKIIWIENYNQMVVYDRKSGDTNEFRYEAAFNHVALINDNVIITTANGKILTLIGKVLKVHDVYSRYSNFIIAHGDKVIYSTQNEIIGCETANGTLEEISFHKVPDQINAIVKGSGKVYVAYNSNICEYNFTTIGF